MRSCSVILRAGYGICVKIMAVSHVGGASCAVSIGDACASRTDLKIGDG